MGYKITSSSKIIGTSTTVCPASGAFTMAGWFFKPTGSANTERIMGMGDGSLTFGFKHLDTDYFTLESGGTTRITSSNTLADNAWHYIAATRDSSGNWELFSGNESTAVASRSASTADSGWGSYWPTGASRRVCFGEITGLGAYMLANRGFAYWRLWTTNLSSAQLEAERLKKSAVVTSGLWAEYDFTWNAGDDTVFRADSSGNSRNLSYLYGATSANFAEQADPTGLSDGASAVPILASTYYRMLGS